MRTFIAVIAACCAAVATADTFSEWKAAHGKQYSATEEAFRAVVFAKNLERVQRHNAHGQDWSMGLNEFADLTSEEFAARYIGGYRADRKSVNEVDTSLLRVSPEGLPASVDWTTKGAVTPVKNQGQCGSCWSFSTTGSIEGVTEIATGQLVSLSEQQLVDCSGKYGNMGCNGGMMDAAFKYVIAEGGLCSESAYPYRGADGICKADQCEKVATISSYKDVPADSDDAFMAAIAQQPVSIAIEADQLAFQFYSGGVLTGRCGDNLDHGVLAVGYGSLNGKDFYKVKISWGASWGEAGYVLLGRGSSFGKAGQCGLLSQPSYPIH
jgi:C1A family cysteine protease